MIFGLLFFEMLDPHEFVDWTDSGTDSSESVGTIEDTCLACLGAFPLPLPLELLFGGMTSRTGSRRSNE